MVPFANTRCVEYTVSGKPRAVKLKQSYGVPKTPIRPQTARTSFNLMALYYPSTGNLGQKVPHMSALGARTDSPASTTGSFGGTILHQQPLPTPPAPNLAGLPPGTYLGLGSVP